MNILKKIGQWIGWLLKPSLATNRQDTLAVKKPEPPVVFSTINTLEKPPKNTEILEHRFYFVMSGTLPKWSMFRCPCGCEDVITLSMQTLHRPHWRLSFTNSQRPTLHPSVWKDKGCMSHFWLRDGRVYWCNDTGTSPFTRS